MSEETTKECNGIDLSCKKTLIHGEVKSRGDDDGDEDNVVLVTGVIEEKVKMLKEPRVAMTSGEHQRC